MIGLLVEMDRILRPEVLVRHKKLSQGFFFSLVQPCKYYIDHFDCCLSGMGCPKRQSGTDREGANACYTDSLGGKGD